MTVLFVSPAEPPRVKGLMERTLQPTTHELVVHARPETFGCDFLWRSRGQWYGVQRKEIKDLLASVQDGRLSKELGQMQSIHRAWVLLEGKVQWSLDGTLLIERWAGRPWMTPAWTGLLASIHDAGVGVIQAGDTRMTCQTIAQLISWSEKKSHNTATSRPGPVGEYGTATSKDWAIHLLQGFPGIGPETARAIFERFGIPLAWTITEDELLSIPGIGKTRARKLIRALGVDVPPLGNAVMGLS